MFKLFQETKTLKWVFSEKSSIDFSPPHTKEEETFGIKNKNSF